MKTQIANYQDLITKNNLQLSDITTAPTKIKRIMSEYYEQFYANIFDFSLHVLMEGS